MNDIEQELLKIISWQQTYHSLTVKLSSPLNVYIVSVLAEIVEREGDYIPEPKPLFHFINSLNGQMMGRIPADGKIDEYLREELSVWADIVKELRRVADAISDRLASETNENT